MQVASENFRDAEIQNLLADERSRCNQYRLIYQTLKEEHSKLKEELAIIHQQLKDSVERSSIAKSSNDSFVQKLEEAIKEKRDEILKLKKLILEQNPDSVRKKIQEEERDRYEKQILEIEERADSLQGKVNNAHYENNVLKTQLEFLEKDNDRAVELLKSEHSLQIKELQGKIDNLESNLYNPNLPKDNSEELKHAEKEIVHLKSKLQILNAEYDEVRAENQSLLSKMQNELQVYSEESSDRLTTIKMLEVEKETTTMQKEAFQNENDKLRKEKEALEDNLQKNRQEFFQVKSQLEESNRKLEIEVANLNIIIKSQKNDYEELKDKLNREIDRLKGQNMRLQAEYSSLQKNCSEKENSLQNQLLMSKQQAFKRCNDAEDAKEQIEIQLKELEIKKNEEIGMLKEKIESLVVKWQLLVQEKMELEKENLVMRTKFETGSKEYQSQFDVLAKQNEEFRREIQLLKESFYKRTSTEAIEYSESLAKELGLSHTSFTSGYKEIAELKMMMEQQKCQYQFKVDSLQNEMKCLQESWSCEKRELQNKSKQYSKLISKLRDRLNSNKNQVEDLEVQNSVLKQNVPVDDYIDLKTKLSDLQKKQDEFREIMFTGFPLLGEWMSHTRMSSGSPTSPPKKTTQNPKRNVKSAKQSFGQKSPVNSARQKLWELPTTPSRTQARNKAKKSVKRTSSKSVLDYISTTDIDF